MKNKFLIITILFTTFGCNNVLEDKVLMLKTIESSTYKIEWHTKSGITKVYPNYIDITNKIENKKYQIIEDLDILDVNLMNNDSLFVIYNKNGKLNEIRKINEKLGLKIIPKNYNIYYTGKKMY